MTSTNGKIVVLRLYMESSDFIYNYTGKLSKTILLTEVPELEPLFRPIKGFFKQVRVSPPISNGVAAVPVYVAKKSGNGVSYELKPVLLKGEYTVEVGAPSDVVDKVYARFKQVEGVKTRVKFENAVVTYIVENARVEEPKIRLNSTSVTVSTLSPALLPNPLVPNQQVRRFTVSPGVLLWIPRMIADGAITSTGEDARRRYLELEECLAEHYSTKHRVVFVNYDNSREPAIIVKAKYILMSRSSETRARCIEILEKTLTAARIYGIGASRANGFGTIATGVRHPLAGNHSAQNPHPNHY